MPKKSDRFLWVPVDPKTHGRPEKIVKSHAARHHVRYFETISARPKPDRTQDNDATITQATSAKENHVSPESLPSDEPVGPHWLMNLRVNPENVLGSGGLDPFNMFPCQHTPILVHRMLNHALLYTWPGVSPANKDATLNPVSYAWLQSCMRSPMAFYAFAFAAGLHHLYLMGEQETGTLESLVCQSYRTKAISLVRSNINASKEASIDDLIVSILILAAQGANREKVPDYSHPKSPLATIQMLDFYASLEYEMTHQSALYYLVEQRGGIGKVRMEGLPTTLQFAELLYCTQTQNVPRWPFLESADSSLLSTTAPFGTWSHSLLDTLASGFDDLPISMYLRSAISMIKLVTILLDHHHRNGYWDLQQLITVRNAAQHKLLSLHQSSLDPLTQLCHTVLLVYSDMVIFPLPAVTQLRSRLGTQLHDNLTWVLFQLRSGPPDLHIASGPVLPLYLWAATFGYFAAEHNVPLRDKFRAVVRDFATRLNIVELADFETSLAMFMWWDKVCSPPAESLLRNLCEE